jgi:tetratricopeptide (TPR) repeat protein
MYGASLHPVRLAVLLFAIFPSLGRAQPAAVAAVQPLLNEGNRAFAQGDYPGARQSFEKVLQFARELPADSPIRYDALKLLTATAAATGQFTEAERYLQQAVEWRESIIGPNDAKLAGDLLLSVRLDLRAKEFDRALAAAQRVQAMHTTADTAESLPVADDLLLIGQIYLAEKKPDEALRSLIAAQRVRTNLAGPLDPGLLPVLDSLSEAFRAIGGASVTEPAYRQALAIRQTLYGETGAELISTIEGLADAYFSEGMFSAAEPFYQRLLALWESQVGKDHPMIAVTLDKLVVFYTKAGEPEKARGALARSVAIRARFLAVGLSHQAADAVSENHRQQAQALYDRALAALEPPPPPTKT